MDSCYTLDMGSGGPQSYCYYCKYFCRPVQIVQISTEQFNYLLHAVCDMDYTGASRWKYVQICANISTGSVHKYRGRGSCSVRCTSAGRRGLHVGPRLARRQHSTQLQRGQKLSPAPGILRGAPDRSLEKVSMKSLESELLIVVSVLRRYYSWKEFQDNRIFLNECWLLYLVHRLPLFLH